MTDLPRARRACFGELIQADGSHHRWFGEDGPEVNLNVFIDDATGNITSLVFSEAETLNSYFVALEQHLKRYGRPRALYTDRFSVFKVPQGHGITQMHQALKKLDIELILANSPQAKGRVERANRTLQDRLVKEMHLKGIKSIVEANEFAQEFLELYNDKFSKKPVSDVDAHRSLDGYDLNRILCRYENRTLLSGLIFQFNNQFFKVQESPKIKCGKGSKVEIRMTADHKMRVFFKEHELQVTPLNEVAMPLVLSSKEVMTWKSLPKHKPSKFHPWRHRQCFWHTIDHNK